MIPRSPIHPLSALVTIALDGIWKMTEIGTTTTVVGLPLIPVVIITSGITCFITVALIEHFVSHKGWGESCALGTAMGILAAVPYFFTGTIAGAILLAWAGAYEIQKLLSSRSNYDK